MAYIASLELQTLYACMHSRLNAAEMFVDVSKMHDGTATQWIAESGVVDLFLFVVRGMACRVCGSCMRGHVWVVGHEEGLGVQQGAPTGV